MALFLLAGTPMMDQLALLAPNLMSMTLDLDYDEELAACGGDEEMMTRRYQDAFDRVYGPGVVVVNGVKRGDDEPKNSDS